MKFVKIWGRWRNFSVRLQGTWYEGTEFWRLILKVWKSSEEKEIEREWLSWYITKHKKLWGKGVQKITGWGDHNSTISSAYYPFQKLKNQHVRIYQRVEIYLKALNAWESFVIRACLPHRRHNIFSHERISQMNKSFHVIVLKYKLYSIVLL